MVSSEKPSSRFEVPVVLGNIPRLVSMEMGTLSFPDILVRGHW
jgi:hypothetical protein